MVKTASTSQIIELLKNYEEKYGVGSVTSIGTVCSGTRTVEYIFHIKDKNGNDVSVEVPSIEEKTIFTEE